MARKKAAETVVAVNPQRVTATQPLDNVRLPPFSGSRHSCAKCGYSEAATIWMSAGQTCSHNYNEGFRSLWGVERLHRVCIRCKFAWDEACVPPARDIKETLIMPVVK